MVHWLKQHNMATCIINREHSVRAIALWAALQCHSCVSSNPSSRTDL